MKIAVIENLLSQGTPYITLRPDNAVLRNNDDFYMPHFSEDIVCGCGIVVRLTRLARSIAPKFAPRCYDSITAGVTFVARDIMLRAISESRPCEEAYSFDRSTAIGTEWITPEALGEGVVELKMGEISRSFRLSELSEGIDEALSRASQTMTLKMGDLLFIAMPQDVTPKIGDTITVTLNGVEALNFSIK